MSILDAFKPKWSAKFMREDDRRKMFWYLKRASSYTAWKEQADAFDRFAELFERQVREQPFAESELGPGWGTHWDRSYPEILRAQVLYEQGLSRLRQGDRTVWLYSDRGVFLDAKNILGYWYTVLVNHGPHGDIYFGGKYVDALTVEIDEATASVKACAGILQSHLAEPPAPNFWSPERMARLDREVPFPTPLPDVPTPNNQISVRTAQPVPAFGIYEPLVEDGCMNYLLASAPAPMVVNRGGIIRPAVWRLIWEDARYLNGSIPDEESTYFRPTEAPKPAPAVHADLEPIVSLESGQRTSKAGFWVVAHRLDIRKRFELGDTFPLLDGRNVEWLWVSKEG
jgi:hypothetical protein